MFRFSLKFGGKRPLAGLLGLGVSAASLGIVATFVASSVAVSLSADAAESGTTIADFSGYWARPGPGRYAAVFDPPESGPGPIVFSAEAGEDRQGMPFIGDDTNPILLPHAAEAVRAQRDRYRRGEAVYSAWALCTPAGLPVAFSMINAVQFLQEEDEITIIYQRGQTVRHVYLNEGHPDDLPLTWFGHSVGHYEGDDTLVIDTIAQDVRGITDRFGTPKSEAMRVVERYTISEDGQRLGLEFYVEDPLSFTMAWSAKFSYPRVFPRTGEGQEPIFAEIICPENTRDASGIERNIPMATRLDF